MNLKNTKRIVDSKNWMKYHFEGFPDYLVEGRKDDMLIVYHNIKKHLDALYIYYKGNDNFLKGAEFPVIEGTIWKVECSDIMKEIFPNQSTKDFGDGEWNNKIIPISKNEIPRLIPIRKK